MDSDEFAFIQLEWIGEHICVGAEHKHKFDRGIYGHKLKKMSVVVLYENGSAATSTTSTPVEVAAAGRDWELKLHMLFTRTRDCNAVYFHPVNELEEQYPWVFLDSTTTTSSGSRGPSSPTSVFPYFPSEMIRGELYLGNKMAAKNKSVLLDHLGITHIINASNRRVGNVFEGGDDEKADGGGEGLVLDYMNVDIEDKVGEDISVYFDQMISFVSSHSKGGDDMTSSSTVLYVHCSHGISRSATLVIAYLMIIKKMTLRDAYTFVRQRRCIVQPNKSFMEQLIRLEGKLSGEGNVTIQLEELGPSGEIKKDIRVDSSDTTKSRDRCTLM